MSDKVSIQVLADGVASSMDGWDVVPERYDGNWYAEISDGEHVIRLEITNGGSNPRVDAGVVPVRIGGRGGEVFKGAPEIKMSLEKTPDVMGKEIERRLLPKSNEYWQKAAVWVAEGKEWYDGLDKTCAEIGEIPGTKPSSLGENSFSGSGKADAYWSAKVRGPDNITAEIRNVTAEQLRKIVEILQS